MKTFSDSGNRLRSRIGVYAAVFLSIFAGACSVAQPKASANSANASSIKANEPVNSSALPRGATIPIDRNGPADTVRAFYALLREKKFRQAIFLTNLRPAIESLTDAELSEFSLDFEAIAGQVPPEVNINGEIITGDQATVTANLPNEDGDKNETQTIRLRNESGVWVIMTADDEAAKNIKQQGKNYFYNLRIETHEDEARQMLERISKAELAHSIQNGNKFADIAALVGEGLIPDDVLTNASTGYDYKVNLASSGSDYFATATPAVYGKSGRLSFFLQPTEKGLSHVSSKDNGGQPLRK